MQLPRSKGGVRIERLAPEEESRRQEWSRALSVLDLAGADLLKSDGAAGVWRATVLGRPAVIKTWVHTSLVSRVKHALRSGRGSRHWEGAVWLASSGIATALPLVLAAEYVPGGAVEWLVMEHLAGRSLLEEMDARDTPVKEAHALARRVGEQAAKIVRAGRFNRDHKPSNLIVTAKGPAVIDTVAIRRCVPGSEDALIRMLASLVIEPAGVGCRPRRAILMRGIRAAAETLLGEAPARAARRDLAQSLWRRVERAVERHGDPVPKVDPRTRV